MTTLRGRGRCATCGAWLASDNLSPQCSPCLSANRDTLAVPSAPDDLPASFWHDPDLQAALDARHMGQVVRAYRLHPHHGRHPLAQDEVATWAGTTQPQLSRLERGQALRDLARLIDWARILRIPERHLWFKLPGPDVRDASPDSTEEEYVDRREFLAGALVVGGEAVGSTFRSLRLGMSGASEFDQVSRAVERAARFERSSQFAALDAVLPGLLIKTDRLMQEPETSQEVAGLLSQVHALHAWLLIKRNEASRAKAAATTALAAAQQADDVVLVGAALRCLGETYLRAGRYDLACDLAIEAAELLRHAPAAEQDVLTLQGAGYLSAAMACARSGNGHGAAELLQAAHACATQLARDVSGPAVFGPSNVQIHRVAVAVDLGDAGAALQCVERAAVQLPVGYEERQARYLMDVARAHANRRRDEDAVCTFLEAEEIAPEEVRTHRVTQSVVGELLRRERRSRTPALRPLAARCGAVA